MAGGGLVRRPRHQVTSLARRLLTGRVGHITRLGQVHCRALDGGGLRRCTTYYVGCRDATADTQDYRRDGESSSDLVAGDHVVYLLTGRGRRRPRPTIAKSR